MTSPRLSVMLWQVPSTSEDLRELGMRYLDPREMALLSPRASSKRWAEFIAGRIAARAAVAHLLEVSPSSQAFLILREGEGPTGCPLVVLTSPARVPRVSISHADGLAVAAACFEGIGVDLASIEAHERCFVEDTFSSRELSRWAEFLGSLRTSALTLTTAFAAKEAAMKWLGTGFALPLRAIEVLPVGGGSVECPPSFPVPALEFPVVLIEQSEASTRPLSARFARIDNRVVVLLLDPSSPIDLLRAAAATMVNGSNGAQ